VDAVAAAVERHPHAIFLVVRRRGEAEPDKEKERKRVRHADSETRETRE
jgi:hypothetical protein